MAFIFIVHVLALIHKEIPKTIIGVLSKSLLILFYYNSRLKTVIMIQHFMLHKVNSKGT